MTPEFDEAFRKICIVCGYKPPISAHKAVEFWKIFIDECQNGYGWTVFEYFDEIGIRDLIEKALNDPNIKLINGFLDFRGLVYTLDKRFAEVTLADDFFESENWWNRKLPKFGIRDFITSLKQTYNITAVKPIN